MTRICMKITTNSRTMLRKLETQIQTKIQRLTHQQQKPLTQLASSCPPVCLCIERQQIGAGSYEHEPKLMCFKLVSPGMNETERFMLFKLYYGLKYDSTQSVVALSHLSSEIPSAVLILRRQRLHDTTTTTILNFRQYVSDIFILILFYLFNVVNRSIKLIN